MVTTHIQAILQADIQALILATHKVADTTTTLATHQATDITITDTIIITLTMAIIMAIIMATTMAMDTTADTISQPANESSDFHTVKQRTLNNTILMDMFTEECNDEIHVKPSLVTNNKINEMIILQKKTHSSASTIQREKKERSRLFVFYSTSESQIINLERLIRLNRISIHTRIIL